MVIYRINYLIVRSNDIISRRLLLIIARCCHYKQAYNNHTFTCTLRKVRFEMMIAREQKGLTEKASFVRSK